MRGKTAEDQRLVELLDPVAEAAGYEIVRLRLMGSDHARRLQILAETPPGVDRPLTRLKDFVTYEGHEARIELDRVAEGRKRFRGVLAGVEGDNIGIDLEGEEATAMVPFSWIVDAKLILTDALMKRGAEERAARIEGDDQQDTPE